MLEQALEMRRRLQNRGPDDWGVGLGVSPPATDLRLPSNVTVFQSARPIAIVNTRLSILDLSSAGHQPMSTPDRRYWIVYNGEVFNFAELRRDLESKNYHFLSKTDTEVVLRLFEAYGVAALQRLNGMFAVAIWDAQRGQLYLARDRFGIKPLYYAYADGDFLFASEMKALQAVHRVATINTDALHQYLTFLHVPEPNTILAGVRKVKPGSWLRICAGKMNEPDENPYWIATPQPISSIPYRDAADAVREKLQTAVARQLVADVPVSAFLSGGLDSTSIVGLMLKNNTPPHAVYAAGFSAEDMKYERVGDDLKYAAFVAQSFGIHCAELVMKPDLIALLPKIIYFADEPLADPALIPTFLICEHASATTKVLLSGMGADEIFGGYRRHYLAGLYASYLRLPNGARRFGSLLADHFPAAGSHLGVAGLRRLKRLLRLLSGDREDTYLQTFSWMHPRAEGLYSEELLADVGESDAFVQHRDVWRSLQTSDAIERLLFVDTRVYLPSHNLNYVDRMSMASSVEVRVPFLDNDLVDLAFSLPSKFKVRHLSGKRILKEAMKGIVPDRVVHRPKTGFSAPIRGWLSRDLRTMVDDLLSAEVINRRRLFNAKTVFRMVRQHRQGLEDSSHQIWALLTLELWLRNLESQASPA